MSDVLSHSLDLTAVHPREAVRPAAGDPAGPEAVAARSAAPDGVTELLRLRTALEDIVALAHSSASATQRVVQMQRRALATLTGLDLRK